MRLFCFVISVCLSFSACSQNEFTIVKHNLESGNGSFVAKDYKSQELYYKGESLISQINYSNNGWQIYDSIAYEKRGMKLCTEIFNAEYDVRKKLFKGYGSSSVNCDKGILLSSDLLNKVADKYFLSKPYLEDLDLLLSYNPNKLNDEFRFEEGFAPSIFTKYGIPFNAVINSFSFIIDKDNLIKSDVFYFAGFAVYREYKYSESILEKVIIRVENKTRSLNRRFEEKFIF